ncbi:MAG: hypothetical protein IJ088_14775 [Clostridia bacterium]|nr:hypothetical protein [Clostridia bacterium]
MSTRGSFILCREGACREMEIFHDAYPQGAGINVVDLIRTKNLDVLYDAMCPDREGMEEANGFSYEACKRAGWDGNSLTVRPEPDDFIRNSLFCEFGYVLDLDRQELQFYVGGQTKPQEDNRFGTDPEMNAYMDRPYYPCALRAVFPFSCVRAVRAERIVRWMEQAEKAKKRVRFELPADPEEEKMPYGDRIKKIADRLSWMAAELAAESKRIPDCEPACMERVYELERECAGICKAIVGLRKKRELMRRDENV